MVNALLVRLQLVESFAKIMNDERFFMSGNFKLDIETDAREGVIDREGEQGFILQYIVSFNAFDEESDEDENEDDPSFMLWLRYEAGFKYSPEGGINDEHLQSKDLHCDLSSHFWAKVRDDVIYAAKNAGIPGIDLPWHAPPSDFIRSA